MYSIRRAFTRSLRLSLPFPPKCFAAVMGNELNGLKHCPVGSGPRAFKILLYQDLPFRI